MPGYGHDGSPEPADPERAPSAPRGRAAASGSSCAIESIAQGGAASRARDGYVVFVEGALPGRRACAPRSRSPSATTRTRARSRCSSRARTGSRSAATTRAATARARPGRRCATSASSSTSSELVDDALAASAASRASSSSRSCPPTDPWRYRNKMEYSFGERDGRRGELVLGFHRRGRWDRIDDARDCVLASERNNAARNLVRDWCRARGPRRVRPPRAGTGFLRNLVVREGRRTGDLQVRLVTSAGDFRADALGRASAARGFPAAACSGPASTAPAEVHAGRRRPRSLTGAERLDGGARRPALPHLAGGLLPDQHRDGRAALRARGRLRRPGRDASASSTCSAGSGR